LQKDFHHAATYVISRLAGFGHREAETVSYCAQYVDDATNAGIVHFRNGALYHRISSAHKALDYRNFEELANHHVWIPFHFLPGNGGLRAGEDPAGSFIGKIVCQPNSHVAQDMIRACIAERDSLYGLHRLGVTMHVFADTWAHQGFAGVRHKINAIQALDDLDEPNKSLLSRVADLFGDLFDRRVGRFVGDALPLGHGAALSYPDRPYLKWRYRSQENKIVKRDNPTDFLAAAEEMCRAMQRFRTADPNANVPGLQTEDRDKLAHLFRTLTDPDGDKRHAQWLRKIHNGYFSFPPVKLEYRPKGVGSWKHLALGTRKRTDKRNEIFPYDPSFLSCDWKLFHDALQAHRFSVIHDILPNYGICAA
jgi:hypothetical protein